MIQSNPMKQMGILYITKSFTDHQKSSKPHIKRCGVAHRGALATHAILWDRT